MIVYDMNPEKYYGLKILQLSEEEKIRTKEILDELRQIYQCESVTMHMENFCYYYNGCDIVIKLNNSLIGKIIKKQ